MSSTFTLAVLLGTCLFISSIPDAASYTKYGRTCQDIGCRRDEVCVMAEDPCSIYQRDNCGRYPTCAKAQSGGANCASTVCGENEYCKTENGMPMCVKKSTAIGYESAGVSYVNGQRINPDDSPGKTNNAGSNTNPYANANAPPAPADPGHVQVNSGSNLGYPAYPSNSGSNSGYPSYPSTNQGNRQHDLGYPPYPSTNQGNRHDLGYPPYPTQNRMPMPGYPGQHNPGYPVQPGNPPVPGYPQQYPGYQNYPYANYPNQNRMHHDQTYTIRRRNNASMSSSSLVVVSLTSFILFIIFRT